MRDEIATLPAACASRPYSPLPPRVHNILTRYTGAIQDETPFSYSREDEKSRIEVPYWINGIKKTEFLCGQ